MSRVRAHRREHTVTRSILHFAAAAILSVNVAILTSCKSEPEQASAPPQPPKTTVASSQTRTTVTTQPGVAGGVSDKTYTVQAIVTAVDLGTRRVTLTGSNGEESSFTASPEIKNLSQLHVNDKVTATFARRMVVTVGSDAASPSNTQTRASSTAPLGEKPGMMVAEQTERVGRVAAIDSTKRTADLAFVDGIARGVPVRADVDLTRYKVGDTITIQVTNALLVIAESPQK
jgi:hypothetical protein